MSVKTFTPRCTVHLHKNIDFNADVSARKALQQEIDITEFLGEGGEVTVAKSLYSPMGSFVIQIPDKPYLPGGDTLYGLVEPMDYVEIRMGRFPTLGAPLPIVMRGFVRQVMRSEVMSGAGRPQRTVIISGNDLGVLFNNFQISRFEQLAVGNPALLSLYQLDLLLNRDNASPLPASAFMDLIVRKLINPYLASILSASAVDRINVDATVTEYGIYTHSIDPLDQPIWNLMVREADTHFNELFLEDREDGVYLVYRPVPWRTLQGEWIAQGTQPVGAEFIEQNINDVISLTSARDDFDVSNIFFASPALSPFHTMSHLMAAIYAAGGQDVIVTDHPNCDPALYGPRQNIIGVRHVPVRFATPPTMQPESGVAANDQSMLEFANERRRVFKELNWDNVVFEHGTIALRGDEAIKPGRYIQLIRGQLRGDRLPEYYVYSVTHRFAPFRHFVTVAQYVRGTSYAERVRLPGSPYLLEGKGSGVYSESLLDWIAGF